MPSFDAVNYSIRPNKAVERSIVFSGLSEISKIVDMSPTHFVGFGSLWFTDFVLAHKLLGINRLTSMESTSIGYSRGRFNQPYKCVSVVHGESTKVLPTLKLNEGRSVVWLDYDTSIGGPLMDDIPILTSQCQSNSVLIVTANAKLDELPNQDENGQSITAEESLRRIAGNNVPTPVSQKAFRKNDYPKLLCQVISNIFTSSTLAARRPETFIKLFDMVYSDGTPMVTVGGILASEDNAPRIQQLLASATWEGLVDDLISVPPLTVKEKQSFDRLMPSNNPISQGEFNTLGFQLKREQIDAYHKYYRHYSIFGEVRI